VAAFLERIGGFLPAVIALTLPVVFLPSAADTYILPRASIVIAGACLGVGVSLLVPHSGALANLRLPLAAAAAAALLAFAFSVSWPLSLAGAWTRYESLPVRLAYLGLAASAVWLLRTRLQRDAVGAAFVFGVSVASLEALQQAFAHVAFRPDGNLGNANVLAALITMAIPLAIDCARRATLFVGPWAASVVVMGAGLVVTTSRSGALGAIAGCLALLTLAVPRRLTMAFAAGSLVAVAGAVAFVLLSPLKALNDDPAALRLHLWRDGLGLLAARPLTGWGEDTTGLTFGHYLTQDYAGLVTFDRVHSGPLDVAVTQGVLGLAALAWVLVVVALAAWRMREQPEVAGLAGALVGYSVWVFFNFDWTPATGAFWLLLGTLWSSANSQPPPRSRGGGAAGAGGAVALALLAIPLAVLPPLADTWYLRGRAALATQFDPLQAQYHWALGTIPELQRAADLGEYDPGMYVQLGDLERTHGDTAAARRAYERALEIDPYYTPARQGLASLKG
jgi:O-antigen ligase